MYCKLDDIQGVMSDAELIQLTDDNVPPAIIEQTNVDKAISRAGNLIDGYLRGRYVLPLNPVPGILLDLAVDVAVYNLYKRKKKIKMPESISEDYKNTLKILDLIQNGKVDIGSAKITAPPTSDSVSNTAGGGSVAGGNRLFSRDSLKGF